MDELVDCMSTMRIDMSDTTKQQSPTSWDQVVDGVRSLPRHEVPALWVRLMARLAESPPSAPFGVSHDEWMHLCRSQFGVLYEHAMRDAGVTNEATNTPCSDGVDPEILLSLQKLSTLAESGDLLKGVGVSLLDTHSQVTALSTMIGTLGGTLSSLDALQSSPAKLDEIVASQGVITSSLMALATDKQGSSAKLDAITLSLAALSRLDVLQSSPAKLDAITSSLMELRSLDVLQSSPAKLDAITLSLAALSSLDALQSSPAKLDAITASLAALSSLDALQNSPAKLDAITASLVALSSLDALHSSPAKLDAITASLAALSSLDALHNSPAKLDAITASLAALSSLDALQSSPAKLDAITASLVALAIDKQGSSATLDAITVSSDLIKQLVDVSKQEQTQRQQVVDDVLLIQQQLAANGLLLLQVNKTVDEDIHKLTEAIETHQATTNSNIEKLFAEEMPKLNDGVIVCVREATTIMQDLHTTQADLIMEISNTNLAKMQVKLDQIPSVDSQKHELDEHFKALIADLRPVTKPTTSLSDEKTSALLASFQTQFSDSLHDQLQALKDSVGNFKEGAVAACTRITDASLVMQEQRITLFVTEYIKNQEANTRQIVRNVTEQLQATWKQDFHIALLEFTASGALMPATTPGLQPTSPPSATAEIPLINISQKEISDISALVTYATPNKLIGLLEPTIGNEVEIEKMLQLFWSKSLAFITDFKDISIPSSAQQNQSTGRGKFYIQHGNKFYINKIAINQLLRKHRIFPSATIPAAASTPPNKPPTHPVHDFVELIKRKTDSCLYIPIALFVSLCNRYCIERQGSPHSASSDYLGYTLTKGSMTSFCHSNSDFDLETDLCTQLFTIPTAPIRAQLDSYDADDWFETELKSSLSDTWLSSMARQTWIASERELPQSPL